MGYDSIHTTSMPRSSVTWLEFSAAVDNLAVLLSEKEKTKWLSKPLPETFAPWPW